MDTKQRRRDLLGSSEHSSANFNRWWFLPLGILNVSVLIAVSIMVFGSSFVGPPIADCSGDRAEDFSCYQQRYQDLVNNSGVEAAFADLKDQFKKEQFVKDNCHQMAHAIGRAAANLYGDDVSSTYSQGDNFCGSGYYHGAMETVVANIGQQNILDEADKICADLRNKQESFNYRNCTHGLGHGFMGLYQNEVFKSLNACDALSDEFGRSWCAGGVFMENILDENNPSNPSKYLKADQPFYPCSEVKTEYKEQCYARHVSYALETQGNDFAKVFDLCGKEVEEGFRNNCYVGLGNYDATQSTTNADTEKAQTEYIRERCMQGPDAVSHLNCLGAAATQLIYFYDSEAQAKALCKSLESADWRAACRKISDEYMAQRQQ